MLDDVHLYLVVVSASLPEGRADGHGPSRGGATGQRAGIGAVW